MLSKKLLFELNEYIEYHLNKLVIDCCNSEKCIKKSICQEIQSIDLEEYIKNNRKPSFTQILFEFIDKKGVADSEIYKKAGIDRRHFSKIRSNPDYRIGKNTAIALAMVLELNKNDTDKLLSSAGYYLSDNNTFDLIVQFCINKKIYDISNVNQALDYFSLKPLTGALE
jgi:hypothetical protein